MAFEDKELKRYNRHIILEEIGIGGQVKLKNARVLIVGAGGLGCPALQYLAAAGVGTIGVIDSDKVDESNLQRQILYSSEDVGFNKAEKAVEKLSKLNPFISLIPFAVKLDKSNALQIFREYDIIIDGSDNFPTRYLVNDACVILKKPLVFGSVFKFEGQVSVFNYKDGPTYRCLFPEPPAEGEVPNCAQIGVLGVLPGVIGTLQANETIKIITGIGNVLSGKLFLIDLLTFQSQTYKFSTIVENLNISELGNYEDDCVIGDENVLKEMDVYELKDLLDHHENLEVIDVRSKNEWEMGYIGVLNIPLESISKSISKIPRNKKVVLYCHHGFRSVEAVKLLQRDYGFKNLYSLKGGIHEWALFIDEEMSIY